MDLFPFSLSLMNINLSNNPITALLQNQFTVKLRPPPSPLPQMFFLTISVFEPVNRNLQFLYNTEKIFSIFFCQDMQNIS